MSTDPSGFLETVLIIDDEPDNLHLAFEILRDQGLEILCARDGTDGLRLAAELAPDLILLDIRMPDLNGFDVCARLKSLPATRDIPVIFLSALDQFEDKAQGFAQGGVDYITKPFDARELCLRVTHQIRLARRVTGITDAAPVAVEQDEPDEVPLRRWLSIFVKARTVLLTDLVDPPDIAALARACGTNRTTLQRIFQEHLGMGVAGFLREQRLQHAHQLLLRGEHRVEDIAHLVGYSGSHELRRAFKQRFGRLPSDVFRHPRDSDPVRPDSLEPLVRA